LVRRENGPPTGSVELVAARVKALKRCKAEQLRTGFKRSGFAEFGQERNPQPLFRAAEEPE
ncbi:MAG: hypothetical protein R3265_10675, partial [Hyphomonas sp.]|nr:hypothetical protein [Hyphomonas sp.]